MHLGRQQITKSLGPCHLGNPDGVSHSWLWPGSDTAVVGIWGMNQPVDRRYLSPSVVCYCFSNKQIFKTNKQERTGSASKLVYKQQTPIPKPYPQTSEKATIRVRVASEMRSQCTMPLQGILCRNFEPEKSQTWLKRGRKGGKFNNHLKTIHTYIAFKGL